MDVKEVALTLNNGIESKLRGIVEQEGFGCYFNEVPNSSSRFCSHYSTVDSIINGTIHIVFVLLFVEDQEVEVHIIVLAKRNCQVLLVQKGRGTQEHSVVEFLAFRFHALLGDVIRDLFVLLINSGVQNSVRSIRTSLAQLKITGSI